MKDNSSMRLNVPLPFPGRTFPSLSSRRRIATHSTHVSMISSFKEFILKTIGLRERKCTQKEAFLSPFIDFSLIALILIL